MTKLRRQDNSEDKQGFTLIEVMLVLGVSGLLLIGVLTGTYSSIASQRYNDSVRSFSEFLRQVYSEVMSPESLGNGNSDDSAIYGKAIFFGAGNSPTIYTATLVGDAALDTPASSFIGELSKADATIFCGTDDSDTTVVSYNPEWEAQINNTSDNLFTGTVIIARSPASGGVHTAYSKWTPSSAVSTDCSSAASRLSQVIKDTGTGLNGDNDFTTTSDLHFCIKSSNSPVARNVVLAADGRNTSAVSILTEEQNYELSSGEACL